MLDTVPLTINGVRSALYDTGPTTQREAVVFVHGNPGPLDDWEVLAPAIARHRRVIAMDMPGYGRAERPPDFAYTIDGYARYLGALLDHLAIERVHFVLHDFGGPWALRWALDHSSRLASLTLINTGILEGYRWHKYAKIWQTPLLGELFQFLSNAPAMHFALNRDNPRPLPRSFIDRIMRFSDWGHKRAVLKLYRASRHIESFIPDKAARPNLDHLPVCVIWGEGDRYLPVSYAHRQLDYFPRAEIHILPGLGHWPFIDDPQAVFDPLGAFLRRQIPAGGEIFQ